jgi:hypothetical protein
VGVGRHTNPGARRPIKHPRRNLQPTVRIGSVQIAAENDTVRPIDRLMNADSKTRPRVPRIQQFPYLGSVGVLKPCCTILFVRILVSAG